jgi:hypothetical protein
MLRSVFPYHLIRLALPSWLLFTCQPAPVWAQADPCASLTPAAIQNVIDVVAESRGHAEIDNTANGTTGAYASAARDNLTYLRQVGSSDPYRLGYLQSWLAENKIPTPYTNSTAVYSIHNYARENVWTLHHARHWASISAVYHASKAAVNSFEATTRAVELLESLGANAGRCYLKGYRLWP